MARRLDRWEQRFLDLRDSWVLRRWWLAVNTTVAWLFLVAGATFYAWTAIQGNGAAGEMAVVMPGIIMGGMLVVLSSHMRMIAAAHRLLADSGATARIRRLEGPEQVVEPGTASEP